MEQPELDLPVWLRVAAAVLLLVAVASMYRVWHAVAWLDIGQTGPAQRQSAAETGIELLGTARSVALAVSGCLAAVGVLGWPRHRLSSLFVAAVGLAFVCSSLRVQFDWRGSDLRVTSVVPLVAGTAAAAMVVWDESRRRSDTRLGRLRDLIELVVVVAIVVAASSWPLRHTTPASGFADVGPFEQIATSDHYYGFSSSSDDVVLSDGRPAILELGGLWTGDDGGRWFPAATGDVASGIIDGRIVVSNRADFDDRDDVAILDVEYERSWITIRRASVQSVSTDGTLWLTDPSGYNPDTVYRVDISRLPASGFVALDQLEAYELDRGDLGSPSESSGDEMYWVADLDRGADAVYRWRAGDDVQPERIAGGPDPSCGQPADARDVYLGDISAIAHDSGGPEALWIATTSDGTGRTRLYAYSLAPPEYEGERLWRADLEIPISIESMVVDERGGLIVMGEDHDDGTEGVWRLPDPTDDLDRSTELDEPDCATDAPSSAGQPPERRQITSVGTDNGVLEDAYIVPLSTDGHHARVVDNEFLHLYGPSGFSESFVAFDGSSVISVTPDGQGGLWVLTPETLRHVDGGGSIDQEVPLAALYAHFDADDELVVQGSYLVPGTGAEPPAILTSDGPMTVDDDGELAPVLDEPWNVPAIDAAVGDEDGGLWLLRDGVLYSVADGEATPLAGDDEDVNIGVPWSVQLASGVPPGELWLGDALLARDAQGRLVIVGRLDGTVVTVDPESGAVEVVGEDPALQRLYTVDGGVVNVRAEPASSGDDDEDSWAIEEVVL